MSQPSHLYAVMDGKICMSLYRAAEDWQDVHEVRARMVAKYGPGSCDEPGPACFAVYLNDAQIDEFRPQGIPYICPVCGHQERTEPLRATPKGDVYQCSECGIQGTVQKKECAVEWNDHVRCVWARQYTGRRA